MPAPRFSSRSSFSAGYRARFALFRHSFIFVAAILFAQPALAQRKPAPAVGFPDAPGKDVFVSKCFQCHAPTMWMDQRQDRRAWESTLYRMVGRGALWTQADIKQIAEYLGATYGKKQ